MHSNSIRLLTLCGILLIASTATAQEVTIRDVRVGFPDGDADRYKVGAWAPVTTELDVLGEEFEGTVVVETADGDGVWTRSTPLPMTIESGNKQHGVSYIKVGRISGDIRVHVRGTMGAKQVASSFTYQPYQRTTGLSVGSTLLLAIGQPQGLEQLGTTESARPQTASGAVTERNWSVAYQARVSLLPEHWFGYEGVDVIILPTGNSELIESLVGDEKRMKALLQWVQMGGHLVVSVSKNHRLVADRRSFPFEPFLPAAIEDRKPVVAERLRGVEDLVQSKIEGLPSAPFVAALSGSQQGARNEPSLLELAPLQSRLRPMAVYVANEESINRPIIVRGPCGLGRITLIAFDTDMGPFIAWDHRRPFWPAVLDLRAGTTQRRSPLGLSFDDADQDLAARFGDRLEQVAPVVSFGWVAVLILGYILIVGPLDYFLLKKVIKRLEWTWLTFPTIVLLVCLGAYFLSSYLKGNQLRINKVDLVDIDPHTGQVQGSTWFTIYSPRFRNYDVGIEPAQPSGDPSGLCVTWLGRPGGGMRGLEGTQTPGVFSRSYDYEGDGRALKGLPVSIRSVKGLTSRWQVALPAGPPLIRHDLQHERLTAIGSFTISDQFPWTLDRCQLFYHDHGWDLGQLKPGQTVRLTANSMSLANLLAGHPSATNASDLASAEEGRSLDILVTEMMFHRLASIRQHSTSEYLDYLDQSWRLLSQSHAAILIGHVATAQGSAAEVNGGPTPACRLKLTDLDGEMKQSTIVRIFIPVK